MAKQAQAKPKQATEYVVLKRERVVVLVPSDPDEEARRQRKPVEAWIPVLGEDEQPKRFKTEKGKLAAIHLHTGDDEKALQGAWKAVAWTNWKGVDNVGEPETIVKPKREYVEDE